jgi:hypothetical protein
MPKEKLNLYSIHKVNSGKLLNPLLSSDNLYLGKSDSDLESDYWDLISNQKHFLAKSM